MVSGPQYQAMGFGGLVAAGFWGLAEILRDLIQIAEQRAFPADGSFSAKPVDPSALLGR